MKILIIGKGFIGRRCAELWGAEAVVSDRRISTVLDVTKLLAEHRPDVVLNAAGVVGKPNVDWCETHQLETSLGNVGLPLLIAEACQKASLYLLHVGSGCVFYGDSPESGGWKENDFANPLAVYSKTKYAADLALSVLSNVGIGRIRMPIDSIPYAANLIDKLASYPTVVDVENSVTIIEDMAAAFYQLLTKHATGIFHVVNAGTIRHREILGLYSELVDSGHTNEWVTPEDLVRRGLAKKIRSNNILSSGNLAALGITLRPIQQALRATMEQYARAKKSAI